MIFKATKLPGAYVIDFEPSVDERGSFRRTFCADQFEKHGLNPVVRQCSVSHNRRKGTLRGLHYQVPPMHEDKLVRCTRGTIFDVIVDLRPFSPTFRRWEGVTLGPEHGGGLYVPAGFAHGFITLTGGAEVTYQISREHCPDLARGIRYDDPALNILWPIEPVIMSERDRSFPDLDPEELRVFAELDAT